MGEIQAFFHLLSHLLGNKNVVHSRRQVSYRHSARRGSWSRVLIPREAVASPPASLTKLRLALSSVYKCPSEDVSKIHFRAWLVGNGDVTVTLLHFQQHFAMAFLQLLLGAYDHSGLSQHDRINTDQTC